MEPGERLLNWLCYYNVPEASPQMTQIFTDKHGKSHQNTVARGLVNQDVWKRVRDDLQICEYFRELVGKTPDPFVTKVNDVACDAASSFYGGRVLLVGDAFTSLRPNMGTAVNQAAFHSNSLEEVYSGKKIAGSLGYRGTTVCVPPHLLNNVVAELGRGTIFSLFIAALAFLWFLIKQRLWLSGHSNL